MGAPGCAIYRSAEAVAGILTSASGGGRDHFGTSAELWHVLHGTLFRNHIASHPGNEEDDDEAP
jgi:hypothetical protein